MPALPDGGPAPTDGRLPPSALAELPGHAFGVYVHVPFCAVRCGYCDFNTYALGDLGSDPLATASSYLAAAVQEVHLAGRVLGGNRPRASTVFFGGGTPTMLLPDQLGRLLGAVGEVFGLAADAEVTVEANPDSLDRYRLARLRELGFTRLSLGMQSAQPHVLAILDRTHDPDRMGEVVGWARAAGFEQVSLDLIYGTPGETQADWRASLAAALGLAPDHVSAYALTVEPGTALHRRVGRGEVAAPDDDDLAEKYVVADEMLTAAGYDWYELSNWARGEDARSRHNLGYWTDGNWWGVGPGAHSHVGGVRWWNVKHPARYAERLAGARSPAQAREVLDETARWTERVMLRLRLAEGLSPTALGDGRARLARHERAGLVELRRADGASDSARGSAAVPAADGRAVLTRRGRLLADAVVRDLLG